MAGLGGKNWSFQEEVTSSDVNGFLADQVVMRFADAATRTAGFGGAGEPTLAEGMVSYLDDANRVDFYNGSAWVNVATGTINPVGLELIKTQTIGTTVSSVTVSDVFSSAYDNYLITVNGGAGSQDSTLRWTLGSTTANYYSGALRFTYAGSTAQDNVNNGASWVAGAQSTNVIDAYVHIFGPNLAKRTMYLSAHALANTSTGFTQYGGGFLNDATQYTSFTFAPGLGTMTGGTIRVYGYRNS